MFTGIIQTTSSVLAAAPRRKSLAVRLRTPARWSLKLGQSIAVDGICSTVAAQGRSYFEVEYMPETLRKTTASSFKKGRVVNLERSLTLNDRIDGHLVQGHVDATGKVSRVQRTGNLAVMTIAFPKTLARYIAAKGSVCINGVSLTVVEKHASALTVALVAYTLTHTNLGALKRNDVVNIEVDMLARYLAALVKR